jgi:hypothetical protein
MLFSQRFLLRALNSLTLISSLPLHFKIYDKSFTMSLEKFCVILGIPMFGTAKKMLH